PGLTLALAARDQHDPTGEAFERPEGRRDVGALRIVVIVDPLEVADPLDPVRHALEVRDGRTDRRGRDTRPERARRRREDVLHVVLAAQEDLRQRADVLDVAIEPRGDAPIADEDPVGQLALPAAGRCCRRRGRAVAAGPAPRRSAPWWSSCRWSP